MKKCVLFFSFILLFLIKTVAQEQVKFGDISPEEVKKTVYEKDPEAAAAVLYESLDTYYEFRGNQLMVVSNYFVRIKILTNDGLDYANQSVSVFIGNSRTSSDVLSGLSGNTYNWEDGKVVKTKLSKEHIFEEKVSENRERTKFTFQAVKPGSVIEYKYEIVSPYYASLDGFIFQRSIPVKYSKYQLLIPEYFEFSKETKGMAPIKVTDKLENQTLIVNGGRLACTSQNLLFEASDLPGLKSESYVWCTKDFMTRVTFELKAVSIPGSLYKTFTNSWNNVDEQLLESGSFGKQFNHKLFKEDLATVIKPDMPSADKVKAIYNMVRSKVKWNDENTLYVKNPKEALKKGLGTSGEINALLICALREAGFDAYPVVMSLRNHGRLPLTHATIDNLNYFIAGVDVDGSPVYMDASAKYGNPNVLPLSCMSDFTRSVRGDKRSSWVDLSRVNRGRTVVSISAGFNDEGVLSGDVMESLSGETRYSFMNKYDTYKDQQKYIDERQTEDDVQISDFKMEGSDSDSDRTTMNFKFTRNDVSTQEDMIYFNPLLVPIMKENLLKEENRDLPVEFSYPYSMQINSKIMLPKGYVVAELPEVKKLYLNEKDASFNYLTQYNAEDHSVSVSVRILLDRVVYSMTEYPHLRDYFTHLVSANNAQIVLKKKPQ